jgi:hypothetical protein
LNIISVVDWAAISGVVSATGGVLAIVKRREIADWFVGRVALVHRTRDLERERDFWKAQANDARATVQFIGESSAFTRVEASELLHRVEKLEVYVPKFEAAITYIKVLLAHCKFIELWAQRNDQVLPAPVPHAPSEIVDDIGQTGGLL